MTEQEKDQALHELLQADNPAWHRGPDYWKEDLLTEALMLYDLPRILRVLANAWEVAPSEVADHLAPFIPDQEMVIGTRLARKVEDALRAGAAVLIMQQLDRNLAQKWIELADCLRSGLQRAEGWNY